MGSTLAYWVTCSGLFDTEAYSKWVMQGIIELVAATLRTGSFSLMLHDSATIRKDQVRVKSIDEIKYFRYAFDGAPLDLKI